MRLIALFLTVCVVTVQQLSDWTYGLAGLIGVLLLLIGSRRRNATCSALAAMVLAALITRPAL